MVTITLKNLINDKVPRKAIGANIYVIRDRKIIFYIGKSEYDVINRAKAHFGLGNLFPKYGCEMEQLTIDNLPDSKKWKVDFYTVADCEKKLKTKLRDVQHAEEEMIFRFGPYLNVTYNINRKSIPEKYTAKMEKRRRETAFKIIKGIVGE